MLKKPIIYYWSPLLLFLIMLMDGQLTGVLRNLTQNQSFMNVHLLLFFIMLLSFYTGQRFLICVAIVLGFIYDSYYTGIIGIMTLCLPLFVALYYKLFRNIKPTIVALLFELIISITFMEVSFYLIQEIFNIANDNLVMFIARLLGPTLLLNIVIFIFLVYPLIKLFKLTEG